MVWSFCVTRGTATVASVLGSGGDVSSNTTAFSEVLQAGGRCNEQPPLPAPATG